MLAQAPPHIDIERAPSRPASNRDWLERILLAQRQGRSCLPAQLGLPAAAYAELIQANFPDALPLYDGAPALAAERNDLRAELLELRRDEWQELYALLLAGRAGRDALEAPMACIVAAACLGGDHLWRDLGLGSREQLRELLELNFPRLASRNVNNMRWKKFFYKQLCEQDGGYVCRSPSCERCPTYHDCFGDER